MATSIAELACGEKPRTQSLTRSPSLFDVPGTEAFASEYSPSYIYYLWLYPISHHFQVIVVYNLCIGQIVAFDRVPLFNSLVWGDR